MDVLGGSCCFWLLLVAVVATVGTAATTVEFDETRTLEERLFLYGERLKNCTATTPVARCILSISSSQAYHRFNKSNLF